MMKPKYRELLHHVISRTGNFHKMKELIADREANILDETTQQGNTALHMAARFGDFHLVKEIMEQRSSLFFKSNHKGETPLHMATSAGRLEIVQFFMNTMKDYSGIYIGRIRDRSGNTPLHGSVRNGRFDIMKVLAGKDKDALLAINDAGESPLSIAIDRRMTNFSVKIIELNTATLDYIGHNGLTPLHCAVKRSDFDIMSIILTSKPELIGKKDERGRTALHYAAALGHQKMVEELVKREPDVAYIGDENSQIPLHLAAKHGQVSLIKALLESSRDTIEMVDKKQNNILHFAAENGNLRAVKYIFTLIEMEDLVNSADMDGNTPLHLAAKYYHSDVVGYLSKSLKVEITAVNNSNKTALAIVKSPDNRGMDLQKHLTLKALKSAYRLKAISLEDADENMHLDNVEVEKSNIDGKKGREMAQIISVMSTLIATFTFTAAFTIPGGFKDDGPDEGMATLISKTAFQAFVISDTIAMTSSITAAVIVFWSSSRRDSESFMDTLPFAIGLTWISLIAMALAFVTGLFVVLQKTLWLAILVCAIGCAAPFVLYIFAPALLLLFESVFKSGDSLSNRKNMVEDNPFIFIARLMNIFFGMLCHCLCKCLRLKCKGLCCCGPTNQGCVTAV